MSNLIDGIGLMDLLSILLIGFSTIVIICLLGLFLCAKG